MSLTISFVRRRLRLQSWLAAVLLATALPAQAQTPGDPYSYTRTSSFTYQANGLLASETIEPGQAQLCVATSYTYGDAYGNKTAASTANCAGASGLALFTSRSSTSTYTTAQNISLSSVGAGSVAVAIPLGSFAIGAANALAQSESRGFDPRFGAVIGLTGPNSLTTSWSLDDFGRKVLETRADTTKTALYYCWLKVYNPSTGVMDLATSATAPSNSPGCHNGSSPANGVPAPGANETPTDAVRYEHSVALNSANAQIGAFARVYYDRAGRKLRSVTQAFDGASQPGGTSRLIVQDTDYNQYGTAIVATQPYFLDSASSTTGGASNTGMTLTDYDALGRPLNSYTTDPATGAGPSYTNGGTLGGSVSIAFGSRGSFQASKTSIAYKGLVTVTTDDQGRRRKEEKNPDGKTVRVTDATGGAADTGVNNGAQLVHQHDAFGNLVTTKDALGNLVQIAYDLRGRKVSLNDPDAGVTAYCYDALGQIKAQQSSNQRSSHTIAACPANSGAGSTAPVVAGWTTLAYDVLARMTQRVEPEYVSNWSYDSCTKGVGKLCSTSTTNGIAKTLVYDSLGRPVNSRTDVASGQSLATAVSYDANGRVDSQTWPTGVKVTYQYTGKGYLNAVSLGTTATIAPLPATPGGTPAAGTTLAAGSVLWQAIAVNAWGRAETHAYGNGINNRAVFEPRSGRLTNLTAGPGSTNTVVDQRYLWNSVNLLTQRIDAIGDPIAAPGVQVADTFGYDLLGRLTQYVVAGSGGSRTVNLAYNALGMLLSKSDVGNYSYPAQGVVNGRPHAVQSITGIGVSYTYDLNGNAVTASAGKWRSIAYTSFNLPDGSNGIQGASGTPKSTWQYDEGHQRIREDRVNASGTRTTWYLHPDNQGGLGFEREIAPNGAQSNRHYLSAGGSAFAVIVTTGALPTLAGGQTAPAVLASVTAVKLEYWHKDQLGSLIATTDHAGGVTARYAYDPFGKRRYINSTYDTFGNLIVDWTTDTNKGNDRGFTGHEHLDDLGLVHMNGRIFDPNIGRFLQADPFIQDPFGLQNYDRYGYCYNSPLVCRDPSGFSFLSKLWKNVLRPIAAIVVAYYTGGLANSWLAYTELACTVTGSTIASFASAAIGGFAGGVVASGTLKGG